MNKKIAWIIPIFALLILAGSKPVDLIRLTIINKAEMDIAVQLNAVPKVCCNMADVEQGQFYYLPVPEGTKEQPTVKVYTIERDTYLMRLYYLETYDPVYGFKCDPTLPNTMIAGRNLRVVVLPCGQIPRNPKAVGEGSMWKYLPYPIPSLSVFFSDYWKTRLIY